MSGTANAAAKAALTTLFRESLISLMTSGPSILATLNVLVAVIHRYRSTTLQRAIIGGAIISIITDIIILSTLPQSIMNPRSDYFTPYAMLINFLKRMHSIVIVHLVFLRSTAIIPFMYAFQKYAGYFTCAYAGLGITSCGFQIYAYLDVGLNSRLGQQHPFFQAGYRTTNLACVLLYSSIALWTDIYFLLYSKGHAALKKLNSVLVFYDSRLFVVLEMFMLMVVCGPLFVGLGTGFELISPTFTEQFLLALISLNACLSINAVTHLSALSFSNPSFIHPKVRVMTPLTISAPYSPKSTLYNQPSPKSTLYNQPSPRNANSVLGYPTLKSPSRFSELSDTSLPMISSVMTPVTTFCSSRGPLSTAISLPYPSFDRSSIASMSPPIALPSTISLSSTTSLPSPPFSSSSLPLPSPAFSSTSLPLPTASMSPILDSSFFPPPPPSDV